MKFQVGSRLAVVGGKTARARPPSSSCCAALYDPTEGEILLNGIDIRKYDYRDYLALFSVVFQDFQLLSFPLGQNVAASLRYHSGRAASCLDLAGFGERLSSLPPGPGNAPLPGVRRGRGSRSPAARPRRSPWPGPCTRTPPFVVLDEPTAALDPVAEMEVYQNFDRIVGDKTSVYISHRLSSCKFCDHIAVFDHGRIVQLGSHSSLVDAPGEISGPVAGPGPVLRPAGHAPAVLIGFWEKARGRDHSPAPWLSGSNANHSAALCRAATASLMAAATSASVSCSRR